VNDVVDVAQDRRKSRSIDGIGGPVGNAARGFPRRSRHPYGGPRRRTSLCYAILSSPAGMKGCAGQGWLLVAGTNQTDLERFVLLLIRSTEEQLLFGAIKRAVQADLWGPAVEANTCAGFLACGPQSVHSRDHRSGVGFRATMNLLGNPGICKRIAELS
jgi:hypothetical protein